ncbi:Rrf2 family transcriptional regulator [Nocardioides sp.]|uniref:RrF2 family transcriptional regulator n=1 Tax=Nocardioides sp. TaxID=35761 RepID=UPI002637CF9E|nr:Rrf2 family transcriptional regulator [Nocardioides sp.]
MQLNGFTDLGLRLVMRLAVLDAAETATTRDLARQLNVSYTHATKVVTSLENLQVIETRRGRGGGIRLTEAGRGVSVGDLVRALEGPDEVVECEGANPCPLREACRLRGALARAQAAFLAVLDPLTVADMAAPPTQQVLLSLTTRPQA